MRSTRSVPAVVLVVVASIVAGCGGSSDDSVAKAKSTADSIKKQLDDLAKSGGGLGGAGDTTSTGCPNRKPAVGRMRVVNLAVRSGAAIGAVDVYANGYGPEKKCAAIIKNLGYGDVSNYVDVPAELYQTPPEGGLTFYDAGTTTRDQGFWKGQAPPDGVDGTNDQETIILTGGTDQGTASPTWTNVTEKSTKSPDQDVKVPAGKSLLLVSPAGVDQALRQGDDSEVAFTIDGRCVGGDPDPQDPSANGPGLLNGNGVPFTVDPGSHTLGLVVTDPGVGVDETCNGQTPAFTSQIDVEAGKALAVYLGGTSKTDLAIYPAAIDL